MKTQQKNATKAATKKSISSGNRLESILQETEEELQLIQPKIEKLEKELEKLKELKLTKQKLITLKLSIKSILENFSQGKDQFALTEILNQSNLHITSKNEGGKKLSASEMELSTSGVSPFTSYTSETPSDRIFLPDQAFAEVNQVLKQKNSTNYEIFRAIVFSGGRATTEQIKQYLVENNIQQPTSGEGFEHVELTDISSRVNYLVRKNLVQAAGGGVFISNLGWQLDDEQA